MNTNYEAVISLIELLVKKAGFDLSSNYSEIELQKTKDSISSLMKERNSTTDKKAFDELIENLKVRQANWENNAEMVGRSLVKAYEEGKDYSTVKMRIELLANLANKGTDNISVGSVYDRIKTLDNDYKSLVDKIDNTDYSNVEEKDMDSRYKTYLENKLSSIETELEALGKELDSLRDVELKDVGIVAKIKEYIDKLTLDKEKIDKAVNNSIKSDVAFDVWERLETVKNSTNEKLEKANDLLSKTEEMLDGVRKNRTNINERKKTLEAEKSRCDTKLKNVNIKLEENDYENVTERMIDVNNSEIMKLELEQLNNKKDVVYVDVGKVKEELVRAWSKDRPPIKTLVRKTETVKPTEDVDRTKELIKTIKEQKKEPKEEKVDVVLEDLEELVLESKKEMDSIESVKEDTLPESKTQDVVTEQVEEKPEVIDNTVSDLEEGKTLLKIEIPQDEVKKAVKAQPKTEVKEEVVIKPQVEVKKEKKKMELDW